MRMNIQAGSCKIYDCKYITGKIHLTTHQRHSRLVKIVRRRYQEDNPGSRLFPNTSGVAWQGTAVSGAGKVELFNPRPVYFGIPEPAGKGTGTESGGGDLLGETAASLCVIIGQTESVKPMFQCPIIPCETCRYDHKIPILTGIEIKTGKSRLKKNQKIFRAWLLSVNGIYYIARECPICWQNWEPVYNNKKIIEWIIPDCPDCGGKGFKLECEK